MNVSELTVPELDMCREKCNFIGLEQIVFEMRSQGIPLEQIAEAVDMSVDGIKKISRKVNTKIIKIRHF